MAFWETLPQDCPPDDAHDSACEVAFRFVSTATPAASDFASCAVKDGVCPPGLDPCRWASCSLYADMQTVMKKRKLKKLKAYPFAAELTIHAGSGRIFEKKKHIDFWMYDNFDPVTAIVRVVELDNAET